MQLLSVRVDANLPHNPLGWLFVFSETTIAESRETVNAEGMRNALNVMMHLRKVCTCGQAGFVLTLHQVVNHPCLVRNFYDESYALTRIIADLVLTSLQQGVGGCPGAPCEWREFWKAALYAG